MKQEEYVWDYTNSYEYMQRAAKGTFPPLIITCAITGGVQGKEANANLPEEPEEQADQTYEAYKAGATMVHIHARDPEKLYAATGNPEVFHKVFKLIRERCPDIIINASTGGGLGMTDDEKMACLEARPEVASLNLAPEIYKFKFKAREAPLKHPKPAEVADGVVHVTFDSIAMYAERMKSKGIRPELEFYNPSNFYVMQDLIQRGLIEPVYLTQFVMGSQAASFPTLENAMNMIKELPPQSLFTMIGTGGFQIPMNVLGILLGGHVRVGMEDNVYYKRGRLLENNAEAVARIVRIAEELNRPIATPAQAREMMGLSQTPTTY